MQQIPDTVMIAVTTAIFVGGSVWGLAWWLSGQFSLIRNLVYEQAHKTADAILAKLELHEAQDNKRFDALQHDVWNIRLRNAGEEKSEKHG